MTPLIVSHLDEYKINWESGLLWKIKANLMMKRIYPLRNGINKGSIELYSHGMAHYEQKLRNRLVI